MASFRNSDMSPDSSAKQGSRIVHPIYARCPGKDGKGPIDEPSKIIGTPNKNITPTNFPINVRLCNRLKKIDSNPSVSPNSGSCGYYNKKNTKDVPHDPTESNTYLGDLKNPPRENHQPGPSMTLSENLVNGHKDSITEKNKKSSIEQKRFYQRKLSGFSPVKLLPVGKLFKFLRPPLQRRNSCPVLSISESEAEAKLNQTLARRNHSTEIKQDKVDGVSNDRNRSCRLTKWTSHQELQRQGKDKNSLNKTSETFESKPAKHSSFKVVTNRPFTKESDFTSLNCQVQNQKENLCNKRNDINEEKSTVKRPASPVIEKTVIIVSESTTVIPRETGTFDNNVRVQSNNVNCINGLDISVNNSSLALKSEDKSKYSSNQVSSTLEINSHQQSSENNVTISSTNYSQNFKSLPIQVNSNCDTLSTSQKHYPYICDQGTVKVYSISTNDKDKSFDVSNENLLNCQNTSDDDDDKDASKNSLCSRVQNETDTNVSHCTYSDDKSEYIEIKPSKSNNILYTPDTVNKSFSTFKSDSKLCTTVSVEKGEFKISEKQYLDKQSGESIIPNPYNNFTLVSPNSHQTCVKLYNGEGRKIYLPNGITNGETEDNSDTTSETYDLNDISTEFQSIFNKLNTERKEENCDKSCDTSSSSNDEKQTFNEPSEHKTPQPQLISITCQSNKTNNIVFNKEGKNHQHPDIKICVVNNTNAQNDTLDFGECSLNSSTTELQSGDINECYNVKLDAPEEVIVAGFHDFCHTMLSLEESLDSHDTGTVKRRKVKPKETDFEESENNHCNQETNKIFNNDKKNNSTLMSKSAECTNNGNIQSTFKDGNSTHENSSDKLLEEIQNSKLLEKMNIKDPDVIDAIAALDNSLREASEQPILTQKELSDIQSRLVTKNETLDTDNKRRANIVREDKIQCDNLIEEVLLEDISKRVPNMIKKPMAPQPPKRTNCIAVTISNANAQHVSSNLPKSNSIHYLPEIQAPNLPSSDRKVNNMKISNINGRNVDSSNMNGHATESSTVNRQTIESSNINRQTAESSNINRQTAESSNINRQTAESSSINGRIIESSNMNGGTTESLKLSDYCLPGGDMKRVNISPDAKDDSSLPTSSISSEDINPTLPLQVSVDNNVNGGLQDVVACSRTSPCSVDSGTSSHNQGYFVVVAIDFGTTYSGYAFSFTRDHDNIHMMKKWDGGDPGVWNQKTPTTLLLSPEGTFHSFGFSARDYYHDLDVEEAQGWLYFEKFKMALHYNEHLSLDTEIAAANGKRMPAVTVFAHALRYFKDHALQELSDQSATRILNEDVRWVVTVPAIWKQPAKQFMRAAAYKAGIASPEFPDQLLIALEPEAASIYCRKMRLHQLIPEETQYQRSLQWQKDKDTESEAGSIVSDKDMTYPTNIGQGSEGSFTVGTRYMVVDCGGGTVDITVHELLDKQGTLKELQKASGGPYGSMGVDMEFENFLCDIFGRDFMQNFKSSRPTGYVDLMIAFEARKRNASPYKSNPLNISLPFSFIDCYSKYKGCTVEAAIKKSNHNNVKWSQGMLRLEPSAMEALFKKTIEQIRKHIEDIVNQEELRIDYIFLVGGFAESLILQREIKEAFSSRLKVVIPQGVSLAILKGAVLFGLDPTTINIRRLRMTYGVGVLNHFIHGVHPREKLVIKNGKQWCADVFDKFVVSEQSVGVGDVVVRRYTPAKDGQSCSVIHIYCSEKDNIYFITDPGVKRCATLILDLSDSRYIQSREIQTRMMFGDTEIKVSALDVTTGKCVRAEIDFLNN